MHSGPKLKRSSLSDGQSLQLPAKIMVKNTTFTNISKPSSSRYNVSPSGVLTPGLSKSLNNLSPSGKLLWNDKPWDLPFYYPVFQAGPRVCLGERYIFALILYILSSAV